NLAEEAAFRATLVELGEQDHVLALVMHHILTDEWSMRLLLEELSHLYGARNEGREASFEELPIQYADFAVWQRRWLSGPVLERELDYWKDRLSGSPELLELPADHVRPTAMNHAGATHSVVLPEDLARSLRNLGQEEGATLFMPLLAGYTPLLARLSGQDDISVGIPIAGRTRAEVEGLIGFFVNALVIRTRLQGPPSFRELIQRVREASLGAYAHQDVPFDMVVEALQPERSLSRMPLVQVMFTLLSEGLGRVELSGLRVEEQKIGA